MTDFDPLASDAPLIVYLDIKSPYAFIARDPTQQMADALGIEVDWRPLTLDIPSYLGSAKLGADGEVAEQNRTEEQWAAVKYAYRDARRYASLLGYTLRGTVKIWDTSLVHIAWMWAKRQGPTVLNRYLDHLYPPFWRREVDAEDPQVVRSILEAAGADLAGFEQFVAGEGRREHDLMQRRIFDAGIYGVPSYVVDGEVFFGREHLPMVRFLLSGGEGEPPDVAYRNFARASS
jgi:2-hydroxychromene-2-carboxylate isomerase